jgi:hypothetical protein
MTNNQDIGAMLRKLAKTPGIVYNPKTGTILADHTATTTGKGKMYSPQDSKKLLSLLQGVCHAKEDLVAVPVAVPVARTLPTRPKKVVCPKKDEFSEWYCEVHDDEPLLHDGEGGFYCYTCDNVVLCVNCESVMDREDIYYTRNSGTLQEEHYCEECHDYERPDMTPA